MNEFGELGVDIGREVFSGGVAAIDNFGVDFDKMCLHPLAAALITVASGT